MVTSAQARRLPPNKQQSEYLLAPDVILVTVGDGSARLLDMAGEFHAVPDVGARMLREALRSGADAAAAQIAAEYGVDRERVTADLAIFLRDLEGRRLVCRQRRSRRGRFALARMLLNPPLHATQRFVRSPEAKARILLALARFSFALLGWTPTVAAWQDAHAHFPQRQAGEPEAPAIEALDATIRAAVAGHPIAVACKERALCAWSLVRAAGLDASLVVGIELFPIAAHCWCEVGAQPLGDDREWCINFTPVARW